MSKRKSKTIKPAPAAPHPSLVPPVVGQMFFGSPVLRVMHDPSRQRAEQYRVIFPCCECSQEIAGYWYQIYRKAESGKRLECQGCAVRRSHNAKKRTPEPEVLALAQQLLARHFKALDDHGLSRPGEKEFKEELWPEILDTARIEIQHGNDKPPKGHDRETLYADTHFGMLPQYVTPSNGWFN